jgi:NAD(P)-dependent dehydrogenase (short-subunit alcohol dehydrogenase family)
VTNAGIDTSGEPAEPTGVSAVGNARELAGRVAIVTGGASGIGLSTSLLLARHGADVAVFGRNEEIGRDAVAAIEGAGARGLFVAVDLAASPDIAPAVDEVVDAFGSVDILVNNAAVRGRGSSLGRSALFEIDADNWDYVQAVNVRAPFLLVQLVGQRMVRAGAGGNIVNVTSSAAFQAANCSPHYAASKAALTSLTRTAAAELGPHGVTVNAVAPSLTRTSYRQRMGGDEFFQKAVSEGPIANLLHRVTEPEDVASVIVFLCLPASRQITGQTVHTSAGYIV